MGLSYNELPPNYKKYIDEIIEQSRGLSAPDVQYQGFLGMMAAPLDPLQLEAYNLSKNTGNYAMPFMAAANQFERGAESFPEHYENYMNPYVKSVIEQLSSLGGRTLKENILPQLEAHFVGLGQERSTARDEMMARAARDLEEAVLREQSKALMQGYGETGKQFQEEKLRQLEAGKAQANLGRYRQAARFGDIEQLQNAGQMGRGYHQEVLGEQKAEHARQQHYPEAQLQRHAALVQGMPHSSISSQVQWNPAPMQPHMNVPGQLGAAAVNLYGAGQMGGMGKAQGGAIKSGASASPRLKKPFGISQMKFKSSNKPKTHPKMKFKHPHEGRM